MNFDVRCLAKTRVTGTNSAMQFHSHCTHIVLQILIILVRSSAPKCSGGFDVYFILDKSSSVRVTDFQVQTVGFVQGLISEVKGPTTRVSIIAFSTSAQVILQLTGDEDEIQTGLENLKTIRPGGDTRLEKGLDEARIQIRDKGEKKASVIVILTDGELIRPSDSKSFERTDRLKQEMGVTVFAVGVGKYKQDQLEQLASKPTTKHVYTAQKFDEDALHTIASKIIDTACVEVTSVQPNSVCVGKSYDIILYGKGFTKAVDHSRIKCNFKYNNTIDHITKPSKISDTQLKCRAPLLETLESFVVLSVSLHHDKFITSDIRVVASTCEDPNNIATVLLLLFLFALLPLSCVWWFYLILPCVKRNPTHPPPPPTPPTTPTAAPVPPPPSTSGSTSGKGKWPTVDASYYGAGGVGGITPVKVQWGEKGATEGGAKLTKTPDAKIIDNNEDDDGDNVFMMNSSGRRSSPGFLQRIVGVFVGVGGLFAAGYRRIADLRPRRGGRSKLFSDPSERSD